MENRFERFQRVKTPAKLRWIDKRDDAMSAWLKPLIELRVTRRATVAFTNKLACIAWNVVAKNETFEMTKLLPLCPFAAKLNRQ